MHVSDKDLIKRNLYFKYIKDQEEYKGEEDKKPKNDSIATSLRRIEKVATFV